MRAIAAACKLSVSTVQGYVKKIEALSLDYDSLSAMSDKKLQKRLRSAPKATPNRPEPDIATIVAAIKQSKGKVTH